MPEPPDVGVLTTYVLEFPWPLGGVSCLVALILAWGAVRGGKRPPKIAVVLATAGLAVMVIGAVVVTSGERAHATTRALVEAAVAGDVTVALSHLADDATIGFGSVTNPGLSRDVIEEGIETLDSRHRLEKNRISLLDAYTETSDRATVHLVCTSTVEMTNLGSVPVNTKWVLVVQRQADGSWKVERLTWISMNGRPVSGRRGF